MWQDVLAYTNQRAGHHALQRLMATTTTSQAVDDLRSFPTENSSAAEAAVALKQTRMQEVAAEEALRQRRETIDAMPDGAEKNQPTRDWVAAKEHANGSTTGVTGDTIRNAFRFEACIRCKGQLQKLG